MVRGHKAPTGKKRKKERKEQKDSPVRTEK